MNWLAAGSTLSLHLPLLEIDWWLDIGKPVIVTIVIGSFSVLLMMVSLKVLDKMTSYSIHRELEEKQNIAVAIVVGAMAIGVALVVASVAQG